MSIKSITRDYLVELKDVFSKCRSDSELRSAMAKYDVNFIGDNNDKLLSQELFCSMIVTLDIDFDYFAFINELPAACNELGITLETYDNVPETVNCKPQIKAYVIDLL